MKSSRAARPLAIRKGSVGVRIYSVTRESGPQKGTQFFQVADYVCAEEGVVGEVERVYGLMFDGNSKELLADINALFAQPHVVDNNAPDRIGGGGKPSATPPPTTPNRPRFASRAWRAQPMPSPSCQCARPKEHGERTPWTSRHK